MKQNTTPHIILLWIVTTLLAIKPTMYAININPWAFIATAAMLAICVTFTIMIRKL